MIDFLMYIILRILIGLTVRAFTFPIAKRIVTGWTRLYVVISPEEGKMRREQILSDMQDEITYHHNEGHAPDEIGVLILHRWMTGLRDDLAWSWPFVPAVIVDKTERFSEALRSFRTPQQLLQSLATLGIMNLAFFSSDSDRTVATWVGLNCVTIAIIVLMWKFQHPWARRIFYSWMGLAVIVMMSFMTWLIVGHHLYELPIFQAYTLALASISPAVLFTDKSWRARLFKGHWWLMVICWLLILGVSLATYWVLTGNIAPFFVAWATIVLLIALLIVSLALLCVIAALVTATVWYGGIRGTSAGLRLMAAGIRRLR